MNLRFQIQTLKKGSSAIDEYILQMRVLADGLPAAGQPLNENELVLYVLGGLGAEYDAVVVNLTTRGPVPSISKVHAILQVYEMRLLHNSSVAGNTNVTSSANAVMKDNKSNTNGKLREKPNSTPSQKLFVRFVERTITLKQNVTRDLILAILEWINPLRPQHLLNLHLNPPQARRSKPTSFSTDPHLLVFLVILNLLLMLLITPNLLLLNGL